MEGREKSALFLYEKDGDYHENLQYNVC